MSSCFVVACNGKYLPGLNAIIHSLQYVENENALYVLAWNIPEAYIAAIENARFDYKITWERLEQKEIDWLGEAEVLMRKRYLIPHLLKEQFKSFCILDADMFLAHNVDRYLHIAEKTDIIFGCGLEQKRRYGDENDQYPAKSGKYLISPNYWNARDLCCSPLFFGHRWLEPFKKTWDMVNDHPYGQGRFLAPEMNALNIRLIEAGAHDWIIPLNQPCWTGLHESTMKAHTRAVDQHGQLFTEDGQEINVVHGQFWKTKWRGWQTDGQLGMIQREFNNSEGYKSRSLQSFDLLLKWFRRFAVEGKVNVNDFDCWKDSESVII